MTLDEIMQRRRELARTQLGFSQVATPTVAGGIGNMINAFTTGLQEHQAQQQEAQGRQAFGQAMASFDPTTGQFKDPNAMATLAMLDPQQAATMSANMYNAAQQMAMEKQREAYESGLPQTPRAKAMADYASGKFGTVGSPEAIAARDAAIRASEAPQLSIEDRRERNRLSDLYTQTGSNLAQLDTASKLIDQGIAGGSGWSSTGEWLNKNLNPFRDRDEQNRTDQFNLIMQQGGLTDAISNALGPAAAANFVRQMTDMSVDPKARQAILNGMVTQLKAANETTRARLQEIAPNEPLPQLPATRSALTPERKQQLLNYARSALQQGKDRASVIKILQDNGISESELNG